MGGSPSRREPAIAGPAGLVRLSGCGLVLPQQLPFERWVSIGRQLSAVCTSAAWCLGDWLVFGETAFTGRYRQAIEQTSLDYQTLRNYAWVAKRFPMSRRRDTLSFGHHAEVAALPEPEQDFWLRKAEEHRWPVKHLRREVRRSLTERSAGRPQPDSEEQDLVTLRLQIRMSESQLETCRAAADRASLTIEHWTIRALERAACEELGDTRPRPRSVESVGARSIGVQPSTA